MINKLSIDDIYGQEYNDVNYELKNKYFLWLSDKTTYLKTGDLTSAILILIGSHLSSKNSAPS